MEQILLDIRYGLRAFVRQPAFSLTAILAIALGIGANTAVFSVVYALLLKPLPFAQPDRLIYVHDTFPAVPDASVSWPKFLALRDGTRTLGALAAHGSGSTSLTLTGRGEPRQVTGVSVSGDFFTVFGIAPVFGRPIAPGDDVPNGGKVIELGYGLWQRQFGGDPSIVGKGITVNGEAYTVIGVMPAGFSYPGVSTEAWVPLALPAKFQGNNFLRLVGRMKPGVTVEQARDDLRAITAAYDAQIKSQRDVRVWPLQQFLVRRNRQMLLVLQGAVAFVLLIACANVANLLLARGVTRRRELSIRAAIGAGRGRLVRQLLTESILLSLAGSVVGILLASWLLRLLLAVAPTSLAGVQTIRIDGQVLGFTVLVAVVTGLLFGLAPARRGFRIEPNEGLRETGVRGATSAQARGASRALVVAEITMAMVLVIGAGLMVKSLVRLERQDPGFRPAGLLTLQVNLPQAKYGTNEKVVQTYGQILDGIRSVPGVEAAGGINFLPMANFGFNGPFGIRGRPPLGTPDRAPVLEYRFVTPGYFTAMGLPMRRGVDFTDAETATSTPVAIVNDTMARKFWPDGNPIGEWLSFDSNPKNDTQIVGVVADTRSAGLSAAPVAEAYFPLAQASGTTAGRTLGIVMRTEMQDPSALLPVVRQRIAAVDPDLPLIRPQTMDAIVEASAGGTRLVSVLTSVFGLVAGLLAALGIYSLIAYSVAQRTRELGIRVALGADRRAVLRLVLGEGLVLGVIGVAAGIAGAALLTGTLEGQLYEVKAMDPVVIALTAAGVLAVTALAAYVPARRALRVDPMIALRAE